MTTNTICCELLAKEIDIPNYQTLVFKNLDSVSFGYKYLMVTVFPNWESYIPEVGEIGYLNYDEVEGGIDTYYDRNTDSIIKYNYSNSIFKKFVKKVDNSKKDILL